MDQRAKLVQWNCLSLTTRKQDLINVINKHDPFLVCLQETWLRKESLFKMPGYVCLREDRPDGYGGVAILIKNSMSFTSVSLPVHSDSLSILAVIVNSICFISLYYPRPSIDIFNEINQIFGMLPKPFICLGDFNSHHQLWGCSSSTYYGEQLLELISSHNLCILNNGSPTRLARTPSAPDLSICTADLASSLSWSPAESTYGSDHFPLIITFPFTKPTKQIRQPRIKHKLTEDKWSSYREVVQQKVENLPELNNSNILVCSQLLANALIESANETFPLKSCGPSLIPSPPWWDSECTMAVNQRKEAERCYCQDMTDKHFDNYLEIANSTKELLRKKKFEGWRRFCKSLSPNVSPSVVWQNIRKFRSAFKESTLNKISPDLAEQVMDRLAPPYVPERPIALLSMTNNNSIDNGDINSPFTLSELKGVLSSTKDSAPGEDGIPYSFLSNLNDNSLVYYLSLINNVMISGSVPQPWRTQTLILLQKPNKPSSDPSSYRPIALSSVLAKTAEHLVKIRLEWFLEHNKLLSDNQFGFRKGKCTIDSLSIFTTDIRLSFSRNDSLVAAFLDINAAYDNVNISILKNKLIKLNVPNLLINFIVNMLYERYVKYSLDQCGNESIDRTVWKGLPQGSVLSPILYNIYTYDLEISVKRYANVLQYADDLLLYVSGRSLDAISESLSFALDALKVWLDNNGLDLSPSKSSVVVFSRKRAIPLTHINYNGLALPLKDQAKFLGVILDSKLSGVPHFEYISLRCERNLNILRCLTGVWWGAHPFTMRLLYNALIRSVLDYGTFLLHPSNTSAAKKLDSVQSKALRLVTGAMKSSPINCLQVECCDPPLSLRRQYLCDKFFFRSFQLSSHPLFPKLRQLSDQIDTSSYWAHKDAPCLVKSHRKHERLEAPTCRNDILPLYQYNYNSLTTVPQIKFDLGISKNDINPKLEFTNIINNDWSDWHCIYTDASKHTYRSCVGVGVYHPQYKCVQQIKFPPETSVYTGECYGLLKAIEYALMVKLPKTIIFSDSRSSLEAIIRFPFKSHKQPPTVFGIRNLLYKCSQKGCTIVLAWVPSHVGIPGNERADQLANEAIRVGDMIPYCNYCSDLVNLSKIFLYEEWNRIWNSGLPKGKFYRKIQVSIPIKPWFSKLIFSKSVTSVLCRMRLGHVCTPAQLHRMNIVPDPHCSCGEYGDLNHVIFSCALYDRSDFFSSLEALRIPFPTSIICLLHTNSYDVYKILAVFLEKYDIKL